MKDKSNSKNNNFFPQLTFEPLSKNNWTKFVQLFGEKGACGNCWCMLYRSDPAVFEEGKSENGNMNRMKSLVFQDRTTGILGFYDDQCIAWCAFVPREDFSKLAKSRVHKRIDDKPVWSIPCFFIHKEFRRHGVSVQLLMGVLAYARKQKIKIIEAYPAITTQNLPGAFAWMGLFSSFEKAGFKVADRTSKNRPMVRYYL